MALQHSGGLQAWLLLPTDPFGSDAPEITLMLVSIVIKGAVDLSARPMGLFPSRSIQNFTFIAADFYQSS